MLDTQRSELMKELELVKSITKKDSNELREYISQLHLELENTSK